MILEAFDYMADHPIEGALCEFGVWQGAGLAAISECAARVCPTAPIYGFDSFAGMPATSVKLLDNHRIVWAAGGYVADLAAVQARLPHARLVKGVFSDLSPLADYGIDKVRFARLDCDIYEGYRDALRLLTPHVGPGALLLFDEGVAPDDPLYHDSVRDSGERAIREWEQETGIVLRTLNVKWTERLAVVE